MLKVFAGRLKQARVRARLSQRALAVRIDVSRASIQRWEAGADLPSIRSILAVGAALGTSSSYLAGLRDTPERAIFPTDEERQLLAAFAALPPQSRAMLLESVKDLLQAQRATSKA